MDTVCGGWDGGWYKGREPGHGVGDALGSGISGPNSVAAVVVHGGAQIPPMDGMWGPGSADCRFLMDEDLDARRRHRGTVKIEDTMYMGIGREVRVEATGAE